LFFPPFVVRLRALMLTIADEHKAGMFRFDHLLSVNGREIKKGPTEAGPTSRQSKG